MVQDVEKRTGDQPDYKTPPSPTVPFPLNYLRLVYEFMVVLVCLPFHFLYFAILPKKRWRRSWSLLEAALMPAIKRIMAAFDLCGFKVSGRDTKAEPVHWWLRLRYGVEFEWVPPLEQSLMSGAVDDSAVERTRVGMFSWKREESSTNITGQALTGLYFHGGAYTHNSAHPKSSSSAIPKKLFQKSPRFSAMYTAEYRLLPDYPFSAALQDAAAAYVALLKRGIPGSKIVLIGDSSGGHLALALARWVRDTIARQENENGEKAARYRLEAPAGLVLFSPWADPSHSFLGHTAEDYIPRSNDCDYLFEVGKFRLHLVNSLLGSHPPQFVKSPYMSPGRKDIPPGTFVGHPPCFVHYGTGERCQTEGERLVANLERDGTRVVKVVTVDTPHDPLLLEMVWNKKQIRRIWDGAINFIETL
ncbi:alpha/beta-hydrolase [Rhodotorula sp. JG-1b]|nr:alpha/beta-hydrolase [Rhodotorula sp. JG-1b]